VKKIKWLWNNKSKWWQDFHFQEMYPFNQKLQTIQSRPKNPQNNLFLRWCEHSSHEPEESSHKTWKLVRDTTTVQCDLILAIASLIFKALFPNILTQTNSGHMWLPLKCLCWCVYYILHELIIQLDLIKV